MIWFEPYEMDHMIWYKNFKQGWERSANTQFGQDLLLSTLMAVGFMYTFS